MGTLSTRLSSTNRHHGLLIYVQKNLRTKVTFLYERYRNLDNLKYFKHYWMCCLVSKILLFYHLQYFRMFKKYLSLLYQFLHRIFDILKYKTFS